MNFGSRTWALLLCGWLITTGAGCAVIAPKPRTPSAGTLDSASVSAMELNAQVFGYTDNFITRIADAYEQLADSTPYPQERDWAINSRASQALAALTDAAGPNPTVNLLDLTVMVTLKRMTLQDRIIPTMLHERGAHLLAAYQQSETEVWALTARVISPAQMTELHSLILRWKAENPDQLHVGYVRFTDFARTANAPQSAGQVAPGSIFSLLYVDPLAGLDPIAAQAQGFRELAERMVFVSLRMPIVIKWQIDDECIQLLNEPQILRLQSTTEQYGHAMDRFNQIIAEYPNDYSQATRGLVDQISKATAIQSDQTIKQVSQAATDQREATIKALNDQAQALNQILNNARDSIILARDSAVTINTSTTQTMNTAEAASRAILNRAMVVVLVILLVGFLWPALVLFAYRYSTRRWLPPKPRE